MSDQLLERFNLLLTIEVRLFWILIGLYGLCLLLHIAHVLAHPFYYPKGREDQDGMRPLFFGQAAAALLFLTVIVQAGWFVLRSYERGACPIQTRYEAYQLFAWVASLSYLFARRRWAHIYMPGVLVNALGLAALLGAIAAKGITPSLQPVDPVTRSSLYLWHIGASFVAYGILAAAFSIELSYLGARILHGLRIFAEENRALLEDPILHGDAHKMALLAFPILTLAIVTGAAWTNNTWGQAWSWEYLRTASPLTWLLMALYLHAMRLKAWEGMAATILNLLAFGSVALVFAEPKFLGRLLGLSSLFS